MLRNREIEPNFTVKDSILGITKSALSVNSASSKRGFITTMQIKGLKKAVGEYQRIEKLAKKDDSWYAHIMYDENTNEVWTDTFYSLGHNEWKEYHSRSICPIYAWGKVTMASVIDAISRGKDYKYNCYIIDDLGA